MHLYDKTSVLLIQNVGRFYTQKELSPACWKHKRERNKIGDLKAISEDGGVDVDLSVPIVYGTHERNVCPLN